MSNTKLENALKRLKTGKVGKTILQAFAYRERDIRGTKGADGKPQWTMEVARLRTDIYNFGVKDGRDVIVARKTELDNDKFYEFFEELAKAGGLEVVKRGKEGQILIVNFRYSVKDMGMFALGLKRADGSEVELRTVEERDQINAANRAKHVADARAAKANGHVPVSRQAGLAVSPSSSAGTVMGQSGGIAGKIEQAIASKIDAAISDAINKAFGNG